MANEKHEKRQKGKEQRGNYLNIFSLGNMHTMEKFLKIEALVHHNQI